ncbi:hypothetical protein RRG08_039315 [Elysia crispata]|uniref:Methyltransferase type 11 domain-containing protein n=1 Tax=Elysia crispata TaxID=231223 RepID=A0AAE0YS23_9GAST|nr:hypothetical protein RRG08_039315 [Elysia crispata]
MNQHSVALLLLSTPCKYDKPVPQKLYSIALQKSNFETPTKTVTMTTVQYSQYAHLMKDNVDKTKMFLDMDQSKAYADSRPSYTDEMFKTIADYCKETNPDLNLAVDVGCGPGMSTIGFAKYFKKVIGVDVSETQVACAPKDVPNCEFKVGYSDKLPFIKSGTVDLFCSGESFNLMPQKETFAEADRVLKPGGSIAIFGYDVPVADNAEVQACIQKFGIKIFQFYPKETAQLLDRFSNLQLPYPGWIRNDEIKLTMKYTVKQYADFMKSTWALRAYREAHPDEDFLGDLTKELNEALERSGGATDYTVTWNLFLLMAHKPKN